MTDNKKGLTAANGQAPNYFAKLKTNFIRFAIFLIAPPDHVVVITVGVFIIGLTLAGLWGR
jgi:hypothetical protein